MMADDSMIPEPASVSTSAPVAPSRAARRFWPDARLELFVPRGADGGLGLPWHSVLADWALLALLVFAFCAVFLGFDDARTLPGNEADVVQALDWTLIHSLTHFGQFPLWNPYLRTGFPFIADPFLHVYNPVATLPVLLFGVWSGFKIALFLSFLAAAVGMWWLGVALGLGRPTRLWMGLMYAFTGQAVARFFQGEYDFVLGFAWIPWTLAFILLAVRTRRRSHALVAAFALALLFFSGNVYYTFYMILVLPLAALVSAAEVDWPGRRLRWQVRPLLIIAVIVLLAIGLTAIQWLPLLDYWGSYTKMPDPELIGSHSLRQIWLDYVSKDPQRPDAFAKLPSEEFYAYTGVWPFLFLAFVPLAYRRGRRREIVFLLLLALLVVAYVATRDMPWAGLYKASPLLNQFRYQTRMLIYGAVALIGLAGCGLDAIWARVGARPRLSLVSVPALARGAGAWLAAIVLVACMVWSVGDVYSANRQYMRSRERYLPPYELMEWLRRHDASVFYLGAQQASWHGPIVANGIRYLDAWYGITPLMPVQGALNTRPVVARPHYMALGNDQTPDRPHELVRRFAAHSIWRLPDSLPFALTVAEAVLMNPALRTELMASEVRPVAPTLVSPNRIAVQTDGTEGDWLVVLTSAYHGWRLTVDGGPARLRNVGGYLAVPLQAGVHRYEFSFSPASFWVGLIVSLATVGGLVVLAVVQGRPRRRRFRVQAMYAHGVLHLAQPLELADEMPVRVTVEPIEQPQPEAEVWNEADAGAESPRLARLGWALFALGLFVYLVTRLWQIDRFPINFFADEATFALLAQDLLVHGLRDNYRTFLPVYFEVASNRWTPVLAVYTHLPAVAMFGKSIVAVRATSALVTFLVPIAVALVLRLIFRARFWWAGALIVAVVPTWFMHSRTAFEWLTMASCYAGFILFYLLYRTRAPKFLFPAILFGAATFYNHASGQLVMAAAFLFLGLSDIRYHLKHWRTILVGLLLVAFLAVPLLRFQRAQPDAMTRHLRVINSYWFQDVPLTDKLRQFVATYAYGLSPRYWFLPNEQDLIRHRMQGYGNLGWILLPLVVAGVVVCLRRVRSAPHRAVLLAALAAPAGAATAEVAITRMMAFIPPLCILAGLGLDAMLEGTRRAVQAMRMGAGRPAWRSSSVYRALAIITAVGLSGASLWMLRDALVNGPTWYTDYGMYGMQYGARELFAEAIPKYLKENPGATVIVSPNWANGTDTFVRFFLPPDQQFTRVRMHDIRYFLEKRRELTSDMVLVIPADEYHQAKASPKFAAADVAQMLPYPDGRPGFYFVHLTYADNVDQLLESERAARTRPVVGVIDLAGQQVQVSHSQFDMGQLRDVFDGDPFSLARGLEANPLVFDFAFPTPRTISGLRIRLGTMAFKLTAQLWADGAATPEVYEHTSRDDRPDPVADLSFDRGPQAVSRLRLEVLHLNAGEEVHIHVREIEFR